MLVEFRRKEMVEDHSRVADRTDFQVDSVVSRVKGRHHDGDATKWTAFCRQFRWYREPIRPVTTNGLF